MRVTVTTGYKSPPWQNKVASGWEFGFLQLVGAKVVHAEHQDFHGHGSSGVVMTVEVPEEQVDNVKATLPYQVKEL